MDPLYKYTLCRLCLCNGQCLIDIFEENGEQGYIIKDAIEDLLQFKVSKMVGVPWCVCPNCLDKLTDFKRFKRQCVDSKIAFENRLHENECMLEEEQHQNTEAIDISHVKIEQPEVEIAQELYPQVILKTMEEDMEGTQNSSFDEEDGIGDVKANVAVQESDHLIGVEMTRHKDSSSDPSCPWKGILGVQDDSTNNNEDSPPQKKRPFPCSDCPRSFANKSLLLIHRRTHTGERPYHCLDCGKSFSKNNDLIRHRMTHTGEKPFSCGICAKRFARNSHLIRHNRMHTGERPYQCLICGKCFSESGHLNQHKRRHAGLKPFKCSDCGKDFLEKSDLMRHAWIHKEENRHVCVVCSKEFSQNRYLKIHMRCHSS